MNEYLNAGRLLGMKSFTQGLLIISIGTVYLLSSLGLLDLQIPSLWSLWPLIPFVIGVSGILREIARFFRSRVIDAKHLINSLFWAALGSIYTSSLLNLFTVKASFFTILWPLVLVWFGLKFMIKGFEFNVSVSGSQSHSIGDIDLKGPWTLNDNNLSLLVGEIYIDITKAFMPEQECHLNVGALAGDVTILIPNELPAKVTADLIAGDITLIDQYTSGAFRRLNYKSPDYDDAVKKVSIYVHLKAGEITVRYV